MAAATLVYPDQTPGEKGTSFVCKDAFARIARTLRIDLVCLDMLLCPFAWIGFVARLPGYTALPDCLDRLRCLFARIGLLPVCPYTFHCLDRRARKGIFCPDRAYCPDARIDRFARLFRIRVSARIHEIGVHTPRGSRLPSFGGGFIWRWIRIWWG